MQTLTSRLDLAAFLARVGGAPERVLMLDYDGTLAPFHVDPQRATPYPEVGHIGCSARDCVSRKLRAHGGADA